MMYLEFQVLWLGGGRRTRSQVLPQKISVQDRAAKEKGFIGDWVTKRHH